VDVVLQRLVAIKMLDASGVDATLAEAQTAAMLRHPGIVTVYEVITTGGGPPMIVSEFIEGCSLRDWLRNNPVTHRQAAVIAIRVATALGYAHSVRVPTGGSGYNVGILHRDLSPNNILMDSRELEHVDGTPVPTPKVTDFGLARPAGQIDTKQVGTECYIAPEEMTGPRRDVYSLGKVLADLLGFGPAALRCPGNNGTATCATLDAAAWAALDISPRLLQIYERAAPRKLARWQYESADALRRDLGCWLRHEPIETLDDPLARVWLWTKRKPGLAAWAGVALLLFAGIVAIIAMSNKMLTAKNTELENTNGQLTRTVKQRDLALLQSEVRTQELTNTLDAATRTVGDVIIFSSRSAAGPTDRRDLLVSVDPLIQLLQQSKPGKSDTVQLKLTREAMQGYIALEIRQYPQAEDVFRQVLEQLGNLAAADRQQLQLIAELGLATTLVRAGKPREADAEIGRILASIRGISVDPASQTKNIVTLHLAAWSVVFEAANAHQMAGRRDEAIHLYQAYVKLPNWPANSDFTAAVRRAEALILLGANRFNAGDRKAACIHLEVAVDVARDWHDRRPDDRAAITLWWRCCVRANHYVRQVDAKKAADFRTKADQLRPKADVRSWPSEALLSVASWFIDSQFMAAPEELNQAVHRAEAAALDAPTPETLGEVLAGYWMLAIAAELNGDVRSAKYWDEKARQLREHPPGGVSTDAVASMSATFEKSINGIRAAVADAEVKLADLLASLPPDMVGNGPEGMVFRAKVCSTLGNRPSTQPLLKRIASNTAITLLEAAVITGYRDLETLEKDKSFDFLRREARFRAMIERLKQLKPADKSPR